MNQIEFQSKYRDCVSCSNCQNKQKVFGNGNLLSRVAIVGEAPARNEQEKGFPFAADSIIKNAGYILDQILLGLHIKREDIFVTNALICRTSDGNRSPIKEELLNCRTRLFDELSLLVNLRYTILLGLPALDTVFSGKHTLKECHGKWFATLTKPCYWYYCTYHPAWILHSVNEGEKIAKKKIVWDDWKKFIIDTRALDQQEKENNEI